VRQKPGTSNTEQTPRPVDDSTPGGLAASSHSGAGETLKPARVPVDCGHLPFLIKRDGTWLYRGSPITRKPMVCLFATVLKREADGSYMLETPAERGIIDVEDVPFIAVEPTWSGEGSRQTLSFRTNTDQCITAGPEHPIRISHDLLTCEPTPYLHVRDGKGSHPIEARINRATYYELVALAEPGMLHGRKVLGVWSDGVFFSLGAGARPARRGKAP
jgi:hypothetical protein